MINKLSQYLFPLARVQTCSISFVAQGLFSSYPTGSGFSRPDAKLRRYENHHEQPFASCAIEQCRKFFEENLSTNFGLIAVFVKLAFELQKELSIQGFTLIYMFRVFQNHASLYFAFRRL